MPPQTEIATPNSVKDLFDSSEGILQAALDDERADVTKLPSGAITESFETPSGVKIFRLAGNVLDVSCEFERTLPDGGTRDETVTASFVGGQLASIIEVFEGNGGHTERTVPKRKLNSAAALLLKTMHVQP